MAARRSACSSSSDDGLTMVYFLAGCAVLLLVLFGGRLLARVDPRRLAWALRRGGGVAALAAAGFLLLRGALPIAIPLAAFGLALMSRSGIGIGGPFGSPRAPGQKSNVRTDRLEMELDHDSGRIDGRCLSGRFAGRTLSSLSDAEALALLAEFRSSGAQEAALVEAYLDWRLPGWRDKKEESAKASSANSGGRGPRGTSMSREEAFAVLGVGDGASAEEIRQAHRRLMMKVHPDQGGSTYLAARINEAKEVLLGRG